MTPQDLIPLKESEMLERIEALSRDLGLFYSFEVWEILLGNGYSAINPIPKEVMYETSLFENSIEQGLGTFWLYEKGFYYPIVPVICLSILERTDIETLPFTSGGME